MNRKNKMLKIEKQSFVEKGFCTKSLGKVMICEINNYCYKNNNHTTDIVRYDGKTFTLLNKRLIGDKMDKTEETKKNTKIDTIAIDPGTRTLITGVSNDHIVEIGTNCDKIITKKLRKIDKIMNDKTERKRKIKIKIGKGKKRTLIKYKKRTQKQKQKLANKIYEDIKNKVTDMQWKVANYLTKNYKNILFGNLSTKSMGETKTLAKITKRVGNMLSIYQLKEKIKYKGKCNNSNYKEIDEAYTSKTCSSCGSVKENLGGNKHYHCEFCKAEMGRDINAAKNILMLHM
jgi:putative transposase